MPTTYNTEVLERLRGRLESVKRHVDWLRKERRSDWERIYNAEINAGLALGRLAEAENGSGQNRRVPGDCRAVEHSKHG